VQRLICVKDMNDYALVTAALTPILILARETGAAIVLVHHAGKGDRAGIDAPLGSTALTGSADNVFVLARNERYRTLSSIQRIGPDLLETVLTMDEATGRVDVGSSRHDTDVAMIQQSFLSALRSGPLKQTDLIDAVEGRRQDKLAALKFAIEAGRIVRLGEGGKADPYRCALPGEHSGSEVPTYRPEPQSTIGKIDEFPKDFGSHSGSQDRTSLEPKHRVPELESDGGEVVI
jgi:hypothetical protein